MNHNEHVHLIQKAIPSTGGVWADFGSGEGAFTLALRDLAGPNVILYSFDKDEKRLNSQKHAFEKQFPKTNITYIKKDFTQDLELPKLDGILMANSLHYVKDQTGFLKRMQKYLKPGGKLLLIEYNLDGHHPPWVPFAVSYKKFETLAKETGFGNVELLEKIPSSYWEEMYSAEAKKE